MNAQELRIGNLIEWKPLKREWTKIVIDVDDLHSCHHADHRPIFLTDEILEKLGTTKNINLDLCLDNKKYSIQLSYNKFENFYYVELVRHDDKDVFKESISLKPIQYVHELQNLYYVINQEELDISELIK